MGKTKFASYTGTENTTLVEKAKLVADEYNKKMRNVEQEKVQINSYTWLLLPKGMDKDKRKKLINNYKKLLN